MSMKDPKFKKACPKCRAKDKRTFNCSDCGKVICSGCSVANVCIDCHISSNYKEETSQYLDDKYKVIA